MGPIYAAGPGHAINKQAQLASAYQELGKELGSEKLKVVGGYTIGRIIGEGSFGAVHIATHRLTGTRCAIKKIPKTLSSQVTREIHHHRRLHHLHIVQLYEIIATESHIWLVTELCSGGELFDYLVERGRLPEGEARRLFGELTVAVGHMHNEGIVHRDLKLENVLLDGELRVKLADLGFAREWSRGRLMETHCGTTGYASPEMLRGDKYGVETDIWSLGIILYILLCGGLPFDDDDERVMRDLVIRGEYEDPEWLSTEARSLIRSLLSLNPAERPTIETIFSHPWFKLSIDTPFASPIPPLTAKFSSPLSTPPLAEVKRVHSGEFSQTEKELESLHSGPTLHLPVAQNSRTPSRTKRRSVSSTLSLERRVSHHVPLPENYLDMLRQQRPPPFSTPSEKFLLTQLNDLGFDVGQMTHSVENDACDSSSASWWLLRAKQVERGDTDDFIAARQASNARKREKLAAYAREERRKERGEDSSPDLRPIATVAFKDPYHLLPEPTTPSRDSPESLRDRKTRSPSMSMLQRATSALLGKEEEERSTSPTKLLKPQPARPSPAISITSPTIRKAELPSYFSPAEAGPSRSPSKGSMWSSWSTFRQFFDQGRKPAGPVKAVVLSRGIAARTPHVNRVAQTSVTRRPSVDSRPVYSRRSSSVNSRRSSVTSMHAGRSSHDNLPQLGRRASQRSHGSATPTSDREQPDLRRVLTRELRSPSMQSDTFRPPSSPLHSYQRRPPQGTASKRIRHIRVIPEARSSGDSIKSNHSSRASSVEGRRDEDEPRKSSPLVQKSKPILRDVFQKEDEWEDEDEFAGGYGQNKGGSDKRWVNGYRAASFPAAGEKKRAKPKEPEVRRGIPASRGAPMPIAEEEEEEE